ncbi:hypothetical protein B0H12DRAFT_1152295 [Mycena haematopus]|nr:hypothetical protein B0H12DRAFT_1152295 [Mycena haematopus]
MLMWMPPSSSTFVGGTLARLRGESPCRDFVSRLRSMWIGVGSDGDAVVDSTIVHIMGLIDGGHFGFVVRT